MNPDDVDRVYLINLKRRPDRLAQVMLSISEMNSGGKWPFRWPHPVDAVDGKLVPAPLGYRAGAFAWGCFRSHQNAIEHALTTGAGNTLVLEDDATFVPDFAARVTAFLAKVPDDWQEIRLGGLRPDHAMSMDARIVAPGVVRERGSLLCHAYIIRAAHLGGYYSMMTRAMYYPARDPFLASMQHRYKVYGPYPDYLAHQNPDSPSDIRGTRR